MRHGLLLILLCLFTNTSFANTSMVEEQKLAESILKKLFNTYGNFVYPIPPKIEIVDEKKRVAAFIADKQSGKIIIEKTVFDICKTFGEDYESALAFIIGHELGHFFERSNNKGFATNYLKWTHTQKEEEQADVWGVFCAYLADYKTTIIVPKLIDIIYKEYGLIDRKDNLYGYPKFKIRQESAQHVLQQVDKLIEIFDTANFLNAMGKYELAASSYQYILQFYQGREIYNNLAVNYALHAMNFTPKNVDQFIYPFEIDANTRIKKPKYDRGGDDLTEAEQAYRMQMLNYAKDYLEIAQKMDFNYINDDINMLNVLSLMMDLCQDCEKPIAYYKRHQLAKVASFTEATPLEKVKLQLALAIAYAKSKEEGKAKEIWTILKRHENAQISRQALFNLETLKEDYETSFIKTYDCPDIKFQLDNDGVWTHRIQIEEGFSLDKEEQTQLEIRPLTHSKLFIFENSQGDTSILRRWPLNSAEAIPSIQDKKYQIISNSNGSYLIYKESIIKVWLLNENNKVVEYVTLTMH